MGACLGTSDGLALSRKQRQGGGRCSRGRRIVAVYRYRSHIYDHVVLHLPVYSAGRRMNPSPMRANIFATKFRKKSNCPNRYPKPSKSTLYIGKISIT